MNLHENFFIFLIKCQEVNIKFVFKNFTSLLCVHRKINNFPKKDPGGLKAGSQVI